MEASSSTSPSTFGFPPRPTLVSVVSASMTFADASTASRAEPPRARTRMPAGSADAPLPLATMTPVTRGTSGRSSRGRCESPRARDHHSRTPAPPAPRRRPARPSRLTLLTRAGEYALGGVRAREMHFTPGADGDGALPCELIAMNNIGYAAVWSAKLISVPQMQVAAIEPVNIVMRVVYNTLDGIINDYFVITASVAKR